MTAANNANEIFRWSSGFNTGLGVVDEQHQALVGILNKIARYHMAQVSDADLLKVFDELVEYTVYHFTTEETLMEDAGVSEQHARAHRAAHQSFIKVAADARARAEESTRDVVGQTLAFLTKWLIKHILGMDRQLGAEVRQARLRNGFEVGIQPPPSGEETTEVLLDALDSLYSQLGKNTEELQITNKQLHKELRKTQQAEEELRIAATAFEVHAGIIITDADQKILRVNKSFERITGYGADEAVGRSPRMLTSGQSPVFYEDMWKTIHESGSWQGEVWNRRKDGVPYAEWLQITAVKDNQGDVTHYVGSFADITERKTAEEEVRKLAFYDTLTKLPNRRLMAERVSQALVHCRRDNSLGALMLIDLDNFKSINDTQGHAAGDCLLVEVATRITSCVRNADTVARLGGDEFVVVLENLGSDERAAFYTKSVAEKILVKLSLPYSLEIETEEQRSNLIRHECSGSLGVTLFDKSSMGVDELLRRADTAMYKAKEAGKNTFCFFDIEMQREVESRAVLESELRTAIFQEQFRIHYQPQVDSATGLVLGAEALIRWEHPRRGMVSPAEFIPLAEDSGLILPMGQWVLVQACMQLNAWSKREGMQHLTLAVNVSARQFSLPTFVEEIESLFDHFQVPADRLKIELTESTLLTATEEIISKMLILKEKGIGFSLDDFGTGYSSLSYLKRLPLDQLKIDQSFVRDILVDHNDLMIAKTIAALGNSLDLAIVAEGVEVKEQAELLATLGCPICQGYYYARPLPLADFETYVQGTIHDATP